MERTEEGVWMGSSEDVTNTGARMELQGTTTHPGLWESME